MGSFTSKGWIYTSTYYCPGPKNTNADAPSRYPVQPSGDTGMDAGEVAALVLLRAGTPTLLLERRKMQH